MKRRQMRYGASVADKIAVWAEPDLNSGCLLWGGTVTRDGYGQVTISNKRVYIHRVVWEESNGAIPKGFCVCHKCDTPSCINPDHLFAGSVADNMADKTLKGRARGGSLSGEKNKMSKLTSDDVKQIVALVKSGVKGTHIADRFGVNKNTVYDIKNGKRWGSVTKLRALSIEELTVEGRR